MKKAGNLLFAMAGFISLALGAIGVILPILPTTPFLLLAAALFARGSERFHNWFLETRLYKRYIEQAVKKKEMTGKSKCRLLCMITLLLLTGFFLSPIWHAKVLIVVIALFHYYYFLFRIRTAAEAEEDPVFNSREAEGIESRGKECFTKDY